MTAVDGSPPADTGSRPEVQAALLVLERMGLSPADLLAVPVARPAAPTFAEYVPVVSAAVTAGTRRAYGSYWNRVVEQWGGRRLDEPTPSEIRQLMVYVRSHVVARRNARGGRSAAEHLVAALRCLYRHAEDDGHITPPATRPARSTSPGGSRPPARPSPTPWPKSTKWPRPQATTPNSTPCCCGCTPRPPAAAAAPSRSAQPTWTPDQCLIRLREKGETVRWQPVSLTLMTRLLQHAQDRRAPRDGQLLRHASGQPITSRRYDHLWTRIGKHLPWVATQQISTHWIRHTT
jgi:integrase/recombinase XerC